MAAIANDWLVPMSGEFKKPYYRKLYETVKSEYETKEVYPAPDDIFNAFAFTPLSKVKVVILGQDPYHEPGQAHGLSFSVSRRWRSRRPWSISIRNFMRTAAAISRTMDI